MPRKQKLRADMTEEEVRQARANAKKHRVLKQQGRSLLTTPEETERALKHVRWLYSKGMTCRQIADAVAEQQGAVVHDTSISCYVRGFRTGTKTEGAIPVKRMQRVRYEAVMRTRPVISEAPWRHGTFVDPTAGMRRVQALLADGFSYVYLTREIAGHKSSSYFAWRVAHGKHSHFFRSTDQRIKALYDKLSGVKAEDMFFAGHVARSKRMAKAKGFAPRHVWDEDTIGDPDAFPEWTGACGTLSGVYLHRKYDLYPVCNPCCAARYAADGREGRDYA